MTLLTKGMVILDSVASPPGSPAKIVYDGPGKGKQAGKTLFTVFIDDMSYGYFLLPGYIATLEEAHDRLLAPARKDSPESVARCAVSYCYLHVDDNEYYGEGG